MNDCLLFSNSFIRYQLRNSTAFPAFLILFLQLTLTCAEPIRMSRTAEVGKSTSGNLLYANLHQQQLMPTESIQRQEDPTTDENVADLGDATSSPFIPSNEEIPVAVVAQETADDNSSDLVNSQIQTEAPASQSLSIDLPLFYPPTPVKQPKYRPTTHYGPPRETYNPHQGRRQTNKDSSLRPFASVPFKPSMLGFPPISNTRENLGLQINWAAKIGRAHRSFYDFLLA